MRQRNEGGREAGSRRENKAYRELIINLTQSAAHLLISNMSSGFGNWNYDQKGGNGGGGDLESGGGGGETASFLGASGMPAMPEGMSWSNFKSSLEAQMPQKVMGMNYQERFKVRNSMLPVWCLGCDSGCIRPILLKLTRYLCVPFGISIRYIAIGLYM